MSFVEQLARHAGSRFAPLLHGYYARVKLPQKTHKIKRNVTR